MNIVSLTKLFITSINPSEKAAWKISFMTKPQMASLVKVYYTEKRYLFCIHLNLDEIVKRENENFLYSYHIRNL